MKRKVVSFFAVSAVAFLDDPDPKSGRKEEWKALDWGAATLKAGVRVPVGAVAGIFGIGF